MKKITTGFLTALLVVCFSAVSFAGYHGFSDGKGRGPGRHERPAMTEQQKQEFAEFMSEKNKLRAEFLNAEVKAGRMSKAEADAHITLMNAHHNRMKDGNGQRPVLSEEAKAARAEYHQKMKALEIQHVKKGMASGAIDKERGEKMIQRLENADNQKGFHAGGDRHRQGGPRHR